MSQKKIHIFFLALATLFCLCSCGLEEPIDTPQNSDGYVEFVARPVGFNNQVVETKAAATPGVETNIYSCYFLVFDTTPNTGNGNLVYCSDNLISGTDPVTSIPTQKINVDKKTVKKVKACFIVNVPKNFIYNASDAPIINTLTALNDAVLGPEHFSYADDPIGVPKMTINGASGVKCIPAFGMTPTDINLGSNSAAPVPITIKRLFAKVSIDLSMDITFSGTLDENINTFTFFQLNNYEIRNLPKKVRLCEKVGVQCDWYNQSDNFNVPIGSGTLTQNNRIYNKTSSQTPKSIKFEFYAPEYYLNSVEVDKLNNNQTHKPENKPKDSYAIYAFLTGVYSQYSLNTKNIQYSVYLGGDAVSDFSLSRNTHYTNTLVICGTDNHDSDNDNLDLRVDTDVVNNPVSLHNKSANCYVINRAQKYEFPAYKGAYNDLNTAVVCTGGNAVRIIANEAQFENNWTDVTNINIIDLSYNAETNMISFKVEKPMDVDMVPNGNVVIALVNDNGDNDTTNDPIIWSWHFWFMSDYGDLDAAGWAKIKDQKYPSTAIMMDRNLGAYTTSSRPSEGIGRYYKYGRKEPFIGNKYQGGGTLYDTNGNPLSPDWSGATKSPTDPCPPGYRVPSMDVWSTPDGSYPSHATLDITGWLSNGVLQVYNGIYVPYSGYRFNNTDRPNITSSDIKPFEVKEQFTGSVIAYTATFKNVKFKAGVTLDTGYMLSRSVDDNDNPRILTYGYYNIGISDLITNFEFISCDYKPAFSKWKENQTSLNSVQLSALKAGLLTNSSKRTGYDFETSEVGSREYGYQVRCVSEKSPVL